MFGMNLRVTEHIPEYIFRTFVLKVDYQNVFVRPINLALEVTKLCYSWCMCCELQFS